MVARIFAQAIGRKKTKQHTTMHSDIGMDALLPPPPLPHCTTQAVQHCSCFSGSVE